MSYRGYDPFHDIGSLDSTTLADHTILLCAYNESTSKFELWISPLGNGEAETAFRELRLYDGTYPGNGEVLASLLTADSTHHNVGAIELDYVLYPTVEVYTWDVAEDPLADVETFTARLVRFTTEETGSEFQGTVWWPYLDFGQIGREKQLVGIDMVSDAPEGLTASVGYDQRDITARTTPYAIDADTLPGQLVPIPVSGPSFDLKLVMNPNQIWEIQAACLYIQDQRLTS